MHDHAAVNLWFVLARAGHFAACLLIAGVFAFDRLAATTAPAASDKWRKIALRLLIASFPLALLTGMWWLAMVTIEMGELPSSEALTPDVVSDVWKQTHFGAVWKLRLTLWLASAVTAALWWMPQKRSSQMTSLLSWLALLVSCGLCASLAWAGHAQMNAWSLSSDVIHLVTSAVWPAGLVPLGMLLWPLRKLGDRPAIARLTNRFSLLSVIAVLVLTATGVVNAFYLVGSFGALVSSGYGITLLVKIGLFLLTALIGAVNLLYLRPRITSDADGIPNSARPLQFTVTAEIVLMSCVIVIVGLLGLLPPAAQ